MINLTLSEAFEFVRKSLDELEMTDNIAAEVLKEDKDLYALIESSIVEVALDIHQKAPTHLVDGEKAEITEQSEMTATLTLREDNSAEIQMLTETARVVSVKACDSYIVTEFITEDSVEAHKQRNQYIRGTADRPRAIICKEDDYLPRLEYYSFSATTKKENTKIVIEYIPYPKIEDDQILISYQLKYPLLYWLVAEILTIVNEPDKATMWKTKFQVEK